MEYSKMKERMLAGYKATGSMFKLMRNSYVALFARQAGLDYVMFDCEHGSYDFQTLHDLFLALKWNGVTSIVRVTDLDKNISRMLDTGADGVMIPLVDSVEQAKEAVKYSKYSPIGDRGFIPATAYDEYSSAGKKSYEIMEAQNKKNITIAQIETQGAVDTADGIAGVNGIDVLLIGQSDLSISLGIPGDFDNPRMHEALGHVVAACRKHNKIFGLAPTYPKFEEKYLKDTGMIHNGNDYEFLLAGMKKVAEYRDMHQKR
jgi:2-keto-3-deoxy-L-rhamnonate aldolase RhmA